MKLLYVYDKGANCMFWEKMLDTMRELFEDFEYRYCLLRDYPKIDQRGFDLIVYQTFPDEQHHGKFNANFVKKTDEKFMSFVGLKVLLDSRDGGVRNGFERFGVKYPRIKTVAGGEYQEKFDCFFCLPAFRTDIQKEWTVPFAEKKVLVHCGYNVGGYPHQIRETVRALVQNKFSKVTNFEFIRPFSTYVQFLREVLISLTVPGIGEASASTYFSLQSGACLLAHEDFKKICLFPNISLEDGVDYVSFNLENLESKLNWLLSDHDLARGIGISGRKKFYEGMNLVVLCNEVYQKLKERLWTPADGNSGSGSVSVKT